MSTPDDLEIAGSYLWPEPQQRPPVCPSCGVLCFVDEDQRHKWDQHRDGCTFLALAAMLSRRC